MKEINKMGVLKEEEKADEEDMEIKLIKCFFSSYFTNYSQKQIQGGFQSGDLKFTIDQSSALRSKL
jgi:hypothetical protein